MTDKQERDFITIEDEYGQYKQFSVEALLTIETDTYALLAAQDKPDETIIMQVENEEDGQYLIGINDPQTTNMVLDAFEIAVDANPAD